MLLQIPLPDPSLGLHAVVQDILGLVAALSRVAVPVPVPRWFRRLPPPTCTHTLPIPARSLIIDVEHAR
jgi:hypothetical protein